MAITYMTEEGYKKLMEEIAYLENVKRPEISRAIGEARDKGDLSENAEYDAAKVSQKKCYLPFICSFLFKRIVT